MYLILSVLGQALVHVLSLWYMRKEAIYYSEELEEEIDLDAEFKPNILNTVIYLISLTMQISTFAINYQVRCPSLDRRNAHQCRESQSERV